MKKLLIILPITLIGLFFLYNYYVPITYTNQYKDKHLFRYQFAVSKIDSLSDNVYVKKVGGMASYFGFKKVESLDTLDKRRWLKSKNSFDSLNASLKWKLIRDDLYINKNGEIGFHEVHAEGPEGMLSVDDYLTKFDFNEGKSLKSVIDTATFKALGSSFYKDKKHIYQYYGMAYGGSFSIYDIADYKTFKVIGDAYAKDKNHIYVDRTGIMENADYKTFTSKLGIGAYAKDKNGYYWWGNEIDTLNIDDDGAKEAIKIAIKELNK